MKGPFSVHGGPTGAALKPQYQGDVLFVLEMHLHGLFFRLTDPRGSRRRRRFSLSRRRKVPEKQTRVVSLIYGEKARKAFFALHNALDSRGRGRLLEAAGLDERREKKRFADFVLVERFLDDVRVDGDAEVRLLVGRAHHAGSKLLESRLVLREPPYDHRDGQEEHEERKYYGVGNLRKL